MTELNKSLEKVMYDNVFIHRNVIVQKLIGGYSVLSHKVKSMDDVDKIIDDSKKTISDSIKKG